MNKPKVVRSLKAGNAAQYIGISRRTLHDLTSAGRIPHSRISSKLFLYDIHDLDVFIESHKSCEVTR